jgi:hypothetical protein
VRTLGLDQLAVGLHYVRACNQRLRVDLGDLAPRRLNCSLLLRAVEPEKWRAFLDGVVVSDIDLRHASDCFRHDGDGTVEERDVGRGRVIVKHGRDQEHGQNETARYAQRSSNQTE